jgi:cation diffusion facilitator CzcD-associated flavoprotein CzcO
MTERVAIVGSGLAALAAHATLRHVGVAAEEIAVFGTDADPTSAFRRRAEAIRQRRMRSESDGHLAAASFPGLAVREASIQVWMRPLLPTISNRFHPSLDSFLHHAAGVRERSGWERSFHERRISRIQAVDGGFELDGEGPFAHVLVATGHAGLAVPDELAGDPRTVHAYEPHQYASTVAVVGAGMAAATEWLNALAAGAEVVSIRRHEPQRRPLNVPRPLFSRRGLAGFHASGPGERADLLRRLSAPSFPPGREWDEPLRSPRFRVAAEPDGAEQIICATGFKRGFGHDPLLGRLVGEHGLETHERWIALAPDCTVPALSDGRRTLGLGGVAAQWAYPAADTIVGAKYAARGFLARVRACRTR